MSDLAQLIASWENGAIGQFVLNLAELDRQLEYDL